MQAAMTDAGVGAETIAKRNQAFVLLFRPDEMVWLVGEAYDAVESTWQLDVVRLGLQGSWMRQRYRYDTVSGVIYFMGERPLSDAELMEVRRSGKPFHRRPATTSLP